MIMLGENGNKNAPIKKVLLVDSSINFNSFKNFINSKDVEIIAFDYDTHNLLLNKKIQHKISEQFLTETDELKIDKQIYHFSDWYDKKEIKQLLQYDEINIGRLFHDNTFDFLLKFLKQFYEIKTISQRYENVLFISNGLLYNIISMFTNSTFQIQKNNKSIQLTYDKIKINLQIFDYNMTLFLSRQFYLKIKIIYDNFLSHIFKPRKTNSRNNILLVEINTSRFKDLFLKSTEFPANFFYYGKRRPAIWNFETYHIMRKSNTKIITENLLNNIFDYQLQQSIIDIKSKLGILWNKKDFFNNFFSIEEVSFWKIINPVFLDLIERRIEKTIFEINITKKLFEKYSFTCIAISSEIGFTEQIVIKQAKKFDIPLILLQHGVYSDTLESLQDNKSKGVYLDQADYFIVWGEITKQSAKNYANIPTNKIKILGSPLYDSIISEKTSDENYILIATQPPQHEIIHGLKILNIEKIEHAITTIAQIVLKQNKKLIIKLHPSLNELNDKKLLAKIGFRDKIKIISAGNILPLIKKCSVLIVLGHSTATLEGQLLKKPVITIPLINYNRGNPHVYNSTLSFRCDLANIENVLNRIFSNKKFKQMIIEHGQNFVQQYLSNIGEGSKNILNFMCSMQKSNYELN